MSVQLLVLLLLAVTSECQTVGTNFIAVYPENIAYYHPIQAANSVRLTALYDGTTISITLDNSYNHDLTSGGMKEVSITPTREMDKFNETGKLMVLTSQKKFAAGILSHRDNSIQTATLLPTDQLGTEYMIPPIPPSTAGPDLYGTDRSEDVTERSPFKLILVSSAENEVNTITLPQVGDVDLSYGEVKQYWVYKTMVGETVRGTAPFLVLFAHSCVMQYDCTCGALYTPLLPYNSTTQTFIIPPVFAEEAAAKTYLLKASEADHDSFSSGKVLVNGAVLLHKPGLLMNLIPEEEFGACFSIQEVPNTEKNWAIIVAPADATQHVQIDNSAAVVNWQDIPDTDDKYKYAKVQINSSRTIFWTKSGLMAVYLLGKKELNKDVWFGNPATLISKTPDHRGCVLEPEEMEVVHEVNTWQGAIQHCRAKGWDLISLSDEILQERIYNWTMSLNLNLTELWMGLRQSSYCDDWYWISEADLAHEDWAHGFPGRQNQGKCGRIDLRSSDPGWTHDHCCHTAKFVCYKAPELLTI